MNSWAIFTQDIGLHFFNEAPRSAEIELSEVWTERSSITIDFHDIFYTGSDILRTTDILRTNTFFKLIN